MDELSFELSPAAEAYQPIVDHQPVSGTYVGENGSYRLELRVDIQEGNGDPDYMPLHLVSGDFLRDVGSGEWDYRYSFIVEHPYVRWGIEEVLIRGVMTYYRNMELAPAGYQAFGRHLLKATIPLSGPQEPVLPATVHVVRWGIYKATFICEKTSPFLRTIELELDRIAGTALPSPFHTDSLAERPLDLAALELDITSVYRRAGIDMHIVADSEIFAPSEAGPDLRWDEDELHNAMEHHFAQWQNEPQWRLYLLIATHYKLHPQRIITGLMYDSRYRDPNDPFPRQGVAAFYTSMASAWGGLSQAEFDRNYLRTCVHELGHALNLMHSFDKDQPDSLSWMNYPWRYPYGYNLPSGWDGSHEYWQECRFEFDVEELRHLRHHALLEVIPGGASFGILGHDAPAPQAASLDQLQASPVALYVRTRPERYLFDLAEPVTVELKLENQTGVPMVVPDMLNPELGMVEIHICDPRGQVRLYQPLFRLCGEARHVELPASEKLYESVFLAYGADGFYFQEPGEYQIWAVYSAGGARLRSNLLRVRVAFPRVAEEEQIALWTFGRDQGHVLYMRGAEHLQAGRDQLREVAERFPTTNLARYIHFCIGSGQARPFKDLVRGQVRRPQPESAARHLAEASSLLRKTQRSALDNITHGQAIHLLSDLYVQMEEPAEARSILDRTVRYFTRMEVKPEVVADLQRRAAAIATQA